MASKTDKLIAAAEKRATEFAGLLMILLALRDGRRVVFDKKRLLFTVDGRTISVADVQKQLDLLEKNIAKEMEGYGRNLMSSVWPLATWRERMTDLITDSHMLFGALALGSIALAAKHPVVASRTSRDLSYLDHKFTPAIKQKRVPTLTMLQRRAKSYIRSMRVTYQQIDHQLHIATGYDEAKRILRAHESCRDLGQFPSIVGVRPPQPAPDIFEGRQVEPNGTTAEDLLRIPAGATDRRRSDRGLGARTPAGSEDNSEAELDPIPTEITHDGYTVQIDPIQGMSPYHMAIQERSIRLLAKDPQAMLDRYYTEIKDKKGKVIGHKMINADDFKTLFADYNEYRMANVSAVHEASSAGAKLAFAQRQKRLKTELDRPARVLFMGGGAGSGKTRAAGKKLDDADLIFDGTFKSAKENKKLIDEVVANGHVPSAVFVLRSAKEAGKANVARSIKEGRVVPVWAGVDGHYTGPQAMVDHTYEYMTKQGFNIDLVNNIQGEEPEVVTLDKFKSLMYNTKEEVEKEFREGAYNEYEANKEKYDPNLPDALEGRPITATKRGDSRVPELARAQEDNGGSAGGAPPGTKRRRRDTEKVQSEGLVTELPIEPEIIPSTEPAPTQTPGKVRKHIPNTIRGCWSYRNLWLPIKEQPFIGALRCGQYCRCYLIYRRSVAPVSN